MRKALKVVALVAIVGVQPAPAALMGEDLLHYCASMVKETEGKEPLNSEDLSGAIFCAGYLSGFTDAKYVEGFGRGEQLYCLPDGTDNGRIAVVVTAYLREKPERLRETARTGVAFALKKAFPCPPKKKK